MVVVSLQQKYAGHVAQVLAIAAQCPAAAYYTKWVIAVDDDVDPTDLNQVLWALSTRCDPAADLDILRNTLSTGLDPSKFPVEERPYGSKALINACKSHRHLKDFPKRTLLRKDVYARVAARWAELGFDGTARKCRCSGTRRRSSPARRIFAGSSSSRFAHADSERRGDGGDDGGAHRCLAAIRPRVDGGQ